MRRMYYFVPADRSDGSEGQNSMTEQRHKVGNLHPSRVCRQ